MMNENKHPPSVEKSLPSNQGGSHGGLGYEYQYLVAASFLVDMLHDDSIKEIEFEMSDDIVIHRSRGVVEYVQVKNDELNQLWSVYLLCKQRAEKTIGTSMVEKSLAAGINRCEPVFFRIVTRQRVNKDLKILTSKHNNRERNDNIHRISKLNEEIKKRCSGNLSDRKKGALYWLKRCYWDVRQDETHIIHQSAVVLRLIVATDGRQLTEQQATDLFNKLTDLARKCSQNEYATETDRPSLDFHGELLT